MNAANTTQADQRLNITPEEVAVILPSYDKETVMRRWQPNFGFLILELAAQGIKTGEVTAPGTYLSAKYPAAQSLEALSGREAMLIKEAAAAIAQGTAWLQHRDMAAMLAYKAQQYSLPMPAFEAMAADILQKYATH